MMTILKKPWFRISVLALSIGAVVGAVRFGTDSALTSQSRVTDAIAHWETYTNLKFTPRTTEASYIYFTSGSGCSTNYLGERSSGATTISLATSCSTGNTEHEIGHA